MKDTINLTRYITYAIEIAIALGIVFASMELFLVYAFIRTMIFVDLQVSSLRKLSRIYQLVNEAKLFAITKALKISVDDIQKIFEANLEENMTIEQKEEVERDMRELS